MPDDLTIEVTYGGGVEKFDARQPDGTPTSVFCTVDYASDGGQDASVDQDAGGSDGAIDHVECELWTDGAAKVVVKASGYPDVERTLSAKSDSCGLITSDEEIELERGD